VPPKTPGADANAPNSPNADQFLPGTAHSMPVDLNIFDPCGGNLSENGGAASSKGATSNVDLLTSVAATNDTQK